MVEKRKIAVVTGAGAGIGRAVTLKLLKSGYKVALAGRNRKTLQETLDLAGPGADHGLVVPTDVSDSKAVDALFNMVKEKFGRLDLLFNNAGVGAPPVPVDELAIDVWQNVVNTNLNGAFYCARAAFGMMRHQSPMGGRIINNGSISAHVPRPFSIAYTATKHAVTGITRTLSLDGRAYNIAVGQIDIGNAATPMTKAMQQGVLQANLSVAAEPVMDVENVASAVLYMDGLSLDANVQFMTIMATNMPYIGRG
ncbi:MAG: 3-oxoacyl-ACP reductase [Sneathiella sp.]|jgi:NAD(P)-dependent dehydrogenase (short-subunit alcohol dehydrogenase family)|uniref:SDR family oxidoreductase n=1 Tax=Sneathiella sp. TaxID=1964365 RepID=UPI000C4357B2|nr:SDR family oxidoreductase [Sneathiella sp.]MAL80582.1 3-oxoacyl-ACP reductase [Sneathiella sp.]